MREKTRSIAARVASKALVVMGFCTTFVFMACYGTRPQAYSAEEYESEVVDSLTVAADSTAVDGETVEGDSR